MSESEFKKTNAQIEAIKEIVSSLAKNICIYGGSRSGKSFIIIFIIIVRAVKAPRSSHLIVRDTFAAVKASIWKKTLPDVMRICFPELSYTTNNTDYILTLPNGSQIKVAGLDDTKKIEKLLGTEYSTLFFNESNQIAYPGIVKLKTRLAEKNNLRKLSLYDLNPTKTSSHIYQVFEDKVDPMQGETLPDPDNYLSIQMNVQSNLQNIDSDYLAILEAMPELERKRFLDGEYDADNSGCAVYAFDKSQHVGEDAKRQPGTVFVGSDFNIDWNSDILASQTNDYLYVWDEVQIAGDTFKKCDALKRKGAEGASVIADSTGKARRTSGKSDHIVLTDAGFRIIHTTNPLVVDKIANLNRCFTLGLIKINPKCKKLIRDLTQLVWDKNMQLDQKTDPSLSHLVDCLAYLCWKLYPLMGTKNHKIRLS